MFTKYLPKKLYLFITISTLLVGLAIFIFLFPYLFPRYALYKRFEGNEYFVLTKPDILNPTYTLIVDPKSPESKSERFISVIKLKRNGLFTFEISEFLVGGKSQNLTLEEVKKVASQNNLAENNPDPDKFLIPSKNLQSEDSKINKLSEEERYYINYSKYEDIKSIEVKDFKKLKAGMTWSEIKAEGIDYDNALASGYLTKNYERRARVKDQNVLFVTMSFSDDVDNNSNSKLQKVIVVYQNREVEELSLELQ